MDDGRISYSSGNFSSITPEETPEDDSSRNGDSGRRPAAAAESEQAGGGGEAGPKPADGRIGRAGRRHARIRDVADLGAVLAAKGSWEERRQRDPATPEPPRGGQNPSAADGRHPADPPASPDLAPSDLPDGGLGPAIDAPLRVAAADDSADKPLDLAEFVIQAAVSGDDSGAIGIPWEPPPQARKDTRKDNGGRTARPVPAAGRNGAGAAAPADGRIDTARIDTARIDTGSRAGRDAEPDAPADSRKTGSDLRIPIVEEEEILLVRPAYEEDPGSAAAAAPGARVAPAARRAAHATGAVRALQDAFRDTPRTPGETVSGFARWGDDATAIPAISGVPGSGAPGGAAGAPATPAAPAASDAADAPAATGKTARTKRGARPTGAAGRQRQGRDTRTELAGRDFNVRSGKRLPTRTAGFESDLRANILSGLAIAAALGAAAWYFTGPGITPPPQTVEADKAETPAPKDSAKPPAAGPPSKAAIFLPPKRIAPAAASALGNLEFRLTPDTVDRSVVSARGDTFGAMLRRAGVRPEDTAPAVRALRKVYDPRTLPIGLELKVIFEAPGVGRPRFLGYRFDSSADRMVRVSRLATGAYGARKVDKIVTRVYSRADGQIETSLFGAGVKAGVPPRVMLQMVRLFSFAVDFQRDLHGGEKFHIMYRSQKDEAGRIVRHGDIVYVSLTVGGKTQKLYLYEHPNGGARQYLNERGQGNRRALMKTPIDGARLTSRFGYRKHPLLGFTKLHAGVDFGARPGTPIYAAGSGKIVKIGWFGAFGRYIRIRHGSVYETAYAHMSRFRRGLRVGSRVKQGETIGYVGRSGRTTGPHLHYEVIRNGRQVNPMKVALPSRENLKGRELKQFLAQRKEIDARFAVLGLAGKRQKAAGVQTVQSKGAGCAGGEKIDPQTGKLCN